MVLSGLQNNQLFPALTLSLFGSVLALSVYAYMSAASTGGMLMKKTTYRGGYPNIY